jgi:hypothetical protein
MYLCCSTLKHVSYFNSHNSYSPRELLWNRVIDVKSDNSKKTGKSFSCFLISKIQISSDDNELNSDIDDVLTKQERQKIIADAIKQNADKDQEDLTAYSTSPVISQDQDVKKQCGTSRCTNKLNEDSYQVGLSGESVFYYI